MGCIIPLLALGLLVLVWVPVMSTMLGVIVCFTMLTLLFRQR